MGYRDALTWLKDHDQIPYGILPVIMQAVAQPGFCVYALRALSIPVQCCADARLRPSMQALPL